MTAVEINIITYLLTYLQIDQTGNCREASTPTVTTWIQGQGVLDKLVSAIDLSCIQNITANRTSYVGYI